MATQIPSNDKVQQSIDDFLHEQQQQVQKKTQSPQATQPTQQQTQAAQITQKQPLKQTTTTSKAELLKRQLEKEKLISSLSTESSLQQLKERIAQLERKKEAERQTVETNTKSADSNQKLSERNVPLDSKPSTQQAILNSSKRILKNPLL